MHATIHICIYEDIPCMYRCGWSFAYKTRRAIENKQTKGSFARTPLMVLVSKASLFLSEIFVRIFSMSRAPYIEKNIGGGGYCILYYTYMCAAEA